MFSTEEAGTGDRTFQIIQSTFRQAGITLSQRKMDPDAWQAAINGPDNKYEDFDLSMSNWTPPVDPEFVLSTVTCAQRGNASDSGYCNEAYDKLYAEQSALVDEKARHQVVNQMQQLIYKDRPYIVLNYPNVLEAHNPAWKGFVLSPLVGSVNNLSMDTLLGVHKE